MAKKDFKTLGNQAAEKFMTPETHDTQEAQAAQEAPTTQPTQEEQSPRKHKYPRINMAFYGDNLEHAELMARIEGVSITKYINNLIEADKDNKKDLTEKAKQFFK